MKVEHKRVYNCQKTINGVKRAYCIGHLYVDGKYFCDTIEDYDRGLDESMTDADIKKIKVYKQTAIPTGDYTVKMNVISNTFREKPYYAEYCGGRVPRLDPVKGYSGILIHRGTNENSSAGCVIVGKNTVVGALTQSREIWERLYQRFKGAYESKDTIHYVITRTYKV